MTEDSKKSATSKNRHNAEMEERKRAEVDIRVQTQMSEILNKILNLALKDIPLKEMLEQVIKYVSNAPYQWITLEPQGTVFLLEDDPEVLVLKAQTGLPESLMKVCARVPFGKCICGRAAISGKTEFANCVDECHENIYDGITPHGHYCVPIMSGNKVLGVLNLYSKAGHVRHQKEEEFLSAVADALAGIIEREKAEEELRISRERYSSATRAANVGVWEWNIKTNKIYIDPVTKEHLGYGVGEIEDDMEDWMHYAHPDDYSLVMTKLQDCVEGKIPEYILDYRMMHKDGSICWILAHGNVVKDADGNVVKMIGTNVDITERKELVKSLLDEKDRLEKTQTILQETNLQIEQDKQKLENTLNEITRIIQGVTETSDTSFRFSNPNMKPCYEIMNCYKKDCPCYKKGVMRCWQVAGTFCGGEVQGDFAQKRDSCMICEVYNTAASDIVDRIGEQFNNMMYVLDRTNINLENSNTELRETQSRVIQQEKMASIGQLAAGVAHEINNPMGFISSNLSTLRKYTDKVSEFINATTEVMNNLNGGESAEDLKKKRRQLKIDYILGDLAPLIAESLEGAERVKVIVQNLKSFSRVDEAVCKLADMNECMESTLNIIWNELKYKSTVKKEYGEIPLTRCYPQQLNQVFMNLLVNAAQAIEKQGDILIKTWIEDGSIYISISDTGSGIPEDRIDKIFEPFFTTKEVGKGTGLGLSITYDIMKKHGGDITVDSEVGKGTTFTVKLPVVEEK